MLLDNASVTVFIATVLVLIVIIIGFVVTVIAKAVCYSKFKKNLKVGQRFVYTWDLDELKNPFNTKERYIKEIVEISSDRNYVKFSNGTNWTTKKLFEYGEFL